MTSVVPSRRMISATSRASRPAARCMGSAHIRARNPSRRSAVMPTIPVVDPDIVATSATSGTLRYSAFSPVIDVIESPKTTLSVSRNRHGQQQRVHERHWVAHQPDEQPLGEDRGLRQQVPANSPIASASGRSDKYRHQLLRRYTATAHGRVSAIMPTTQASAGPIDRPGDRGHPWSGVTGQCLHGVDELRDGLIADDRLDPLGKTVQRLDSHRQEAEDQLRQQQPLGGRCGISRIGADDVSQERQRQAGEQHQETEHHDVQRARGEIGSR